MEKVVINIVDTQNLFIAQERFTQMGAPVLSYSGGESRFTSIMSSKFTFNMLNETGEDGKYLDLLSGQERRFRVDVREVKADGTYDESDASIIWRGYLLPDVYSEPYDNVSFFVNFTATDGLDVLREKPFLFWKTGSLVDCIAKCLFETGLTTEIYFAPGIENSHFDYKSIQVFNEVFTKYNESSETYEYSNCYDVLDKLLKAVAATLFQHKGKWYIVGYNRKVKMLDTFKVYDCFGKYIRNETVMRNSIEPFYDASPNITAVSPFKTVQLNVDFERSEKEVLPESLYKTDEYQFEDLHWPELKQQLPFKNWINRAGSDIFFDSEDSTQYLQLTNENLTGSDYQHPANEVPRTYLKSPYYLNVYKHFSRPVNFEKDYVELAVNKRVFISPQVDDKPLILDVDLEMKVNYNVSKADYDQDFYRQAIRIDLLIDDEVIFSTRAENSHIYNADDLKLTFLEAVQGPEYRWYSFPNTPPNSPNYRLKRFYTPAALKAEIKRKDIRLNTYGALNVRVYLPRNKDNSYVANDGKHASMVTITKLNVGVKSWDNQRYQKVRTISYTTKFETDLPLGDGKNDLYDNLFKINDREDYKSYFNTIVIYNDYIATIQDALYYYVPLNGTTIGYVEERFSSLCFHLHSTKVYAHQIFGTLAPESGLDIYQGQLRISKARINEFPQYREMLHNANKVTLGEHEVMSLGVGSVSRSKYLDWQFDGNTFVGRYLDAYSRLIHECQPTMTPQIEVTAKAIVTPMDILKFKWVHDRNFYPINLSINFSTGKTNLTIIEALTQNLNDYA